MVLISLCVTGNTSGSLSLKKLLQIFFEQHRKHHIEEEMGYFTKLLTKFYKELND